MFGSPGTGTGAAAGTTAELHYRIDRPTEARLRTDEAVDVMYDFGDMTVLCCDRGHLVRCGYVLLLELRCRQPLPAPPATATGALLIRCALPSVALAAACDLILEPLFGHAVGSEPSDPV